MDTPILKLQYTDETTKQILENVRKRKKKFDDSKKLHNYWIMATLVVSFIYLYYFYITIGKQYSYSFFAMFSVSVSDLKNLILLAMTILMYGWMNVLKQKKDKFEKEYHDLRCEIVDRSKDLWKKEEQWKNRHVDFEIIKKTYDINLYHAKK
ncbi:YpbF family protein [Neobacillus cucumis]|uniref:YpbF family protein n=1 Tax=Neobacillus cucumis TaxID=1740721 RepID=UPI0018DFC34A|nr:YpbF family protein [Neobacillus cucumis]MBI0576185.1 YpbF family protein [Neobacillus cucumis]